MDWMFIVVLAVRIICLIKVQLLIKHASPLKIQAYKVKKQIRLDLCFV
jgi:hypothetical protein